jgi:hypothetical protein
MANKQIKKGGIVAGAGCLFAIAPIVVALVVVPFSSDIGNTLPWLTFLTAPAGAIAVIVGIVMAIVGSSKSKPEDLVKGTASGAVPTPSATPATGAVPTPSATPATAVSLPPLSRGLARSVKLAYAIGFGVVLVSCVMRVTLFQPGFSILTIFDMVPAFFAGWLVWLARKSSEGLHFLQLAQSQMIVSIAGCVAGLWPLIFLEEHIALLDSDGIDRFQWAGTIVTGLIPFAASIASLIFAGVVRARYRREIAKG